jgi:hypothetical protein
MPDWLRVVPEDLHVSAAAVDVHADDVQVRHTALDDFCGRQVATQHDRPVRTDC